MFALSRSLTNRKPRNGFQDDHESLRVLSVSDELTDLLVGNKRETIDDGEVAVNVVELFDLLK